MKHIPMGRQKKLTDRRVSPSSRPGSGESLRSPAFDLFVDRGLHALFDPVIGEAIPEELLRAIEDDRKLPDDGKLGDAGPPAELPLNRGKKRRNAPAK